jgi:hypothetical protein
VLGGVRRGALLDDRDAVWLHHRDVVTALDVGDPNATANAIAHGVEQDLIERVELRPQALQLLDDRAFGVRVNEHHVLFRDGLLRAGGADDDDAVTGVRAICEHRR